MTSEGTVMGGEYADIIDSKDYVVRNIAYKSQKLLNSSPKLAFDNTGISQLEGVVTNVLKEASLMGIIAVGDDASRFIPRILHPGRKPAGRTVRNGTTRAAGSALASPGPSIMQPFPAR